MTDAYIRELARSFEGAPFLRVAYVDAYLGPEMASFDVLAWPSRCLKEPRYSLLDVHGSRRESNTLRHLRTLAEDPTFDPCQINARFMVLGESTHKPPMIWASIRADRVETRTATKWSLQVGIYGNDQTLVVGSLEQAEKIVESAVELNPEELEERVAFALEEPKNGPVSRFVGRVAENVVSNLLANGVVAVLGFFAGIVVGRGVG
ncbi:hypothetical protein K1Y78_48790 [Streptomyces sp. tea 10]|nr:hypothetical protein [Streptomyces sp. tea 10]